MNETLAKKIAENSRTVCVFDLDSTLFNVSPRTQRILNEFAELHRPELKEVQILHTDWGLKEALLRAGYEFDEHPDLHASLRDFWVERFFSNAYLQYDIPYLGAVAFVQRLHLAGCEIHYLTGRDVHRMGQGTKDVLLKWGFPLQKNQAQEDNIHLKPHRSLDDHSFKLNWVLQKFPADRQQTPLYFFENEPVNINALGKIRPDVQIVFLETTHSRQQEIEVPVIRIPHFYSQGG